MAWQIIYHDERLQQAILGLPDGVVARYFHCTDRMLEHGPDLGMPHTRALRKGMFELRLKSKEGIGRVFFAVLINHRIVMLHLFMKKTEKTPPKEMEIALRRLKEWKDADA
jgi:phage-related protein